MDIGNSAKCVYNVDNRFANDFFNLIKAFDSCCESIVSSVDTMTEFNVRLTLEQYDVIDRYIRLSKWNAYCLSIGDFNPFVFSNYYEWNKRVKELQKSAKEDSKLPEFLFNDCEKCGIKDVCGYRKEYEETIRKIDSIGAPSLKNLSISCHYYRATSSLGLCQSGPTFGNQGVMGICN